MDGTGTNPNIVPNAPLPDSSAISRTDPKKNETASPAGATPGKVFQGSGAGNEGATSYDTSRPALEHGVSPHAPPDAAKASAAAEQAKLRPAPRHFSKLSSRSEGMMASPAEIAAIQAARATAAPARPAPAEGVPVKEGRLSNFRPIFGPIPVVANPTAPPRPTPAAAASPTAPAGTIAPAGTRDTISGHGTFNEALESVKGVKGRPDIEGVEGFLKKNASAKGEDGSKDWVIRYSQGSKTYKACYLEKGVPKEETITETSFEKLKAKMLEAGRPNHIPVPPGRYDPPKK